MEAEPELVNTDSKVDLTPDDMETVNMDAEIQSTLDSPEKRDAREHQPDDNNMAETSPEKARMARLRSMLASMAMGR